MLSVFFSDGLKNVPGNFIYNDKSTTFAGQNQCCIIKEKQRIKWQK